MTSLLNFRVRTEPEPEATPDDVRVPEAAPAAPAPAPAPLVLLEGDRMTRQDSLITALAHAFRLARRRSRDLAEREGGMVSGLASGHIPSVREQHEYATARNWVPPGHDGGVLEGMGVVFHWVIGRPWVALANAQGAIASRPLRWSIAAGLSLIGANVGLFLLHLGEWAVIADAGAVLLVTLWALAGYALMRLTGGPPARDFEIHDDKEDF